ncbi:MAG: hypothetical protein HY906_01120 [Deltaproteobacteria bacterium]|nr:hypothetical protein [Deltaproteobacteria bacterium]
MAHHAHALREEGAEHEVVIAFCGGDDGAITVDRERALVAFARRLTALASPMTEADLQPLRAVGLDDAGVRLLVQVVGYFNYVNRHVEGLGVELEPGHAGKAYGDAAVPRHAE